MWDQSLTSELPAPRDDEPESLRADIVDELADHLSCALARELHHKDEPTARRYVIERFGNPTHIARRLWWDAMKERIMSQRITAVMSVVAAAACIVGCICLWQMMQQGQQAQASMIAAQHEFSQALLERLETLANNPEEVDPRYAGWAPVSLRLVDAADGTTPVAGSAVISGGPFGASDPNRMENEVRRSAEADTDGLVDLGTVPLGKYTIQIDCDASGTESSRSLIIGPEGYEDVVVRCPVAKPEPAELAFEFPNLPESMQNVMFEVDIGVMGDEIDGQNWYRDDAYHSLLVRADGTIIGEMRDRRSGDYRRVGPPLEVEERQAEIVAAPTLTAEEHYLTRVQALSPREDVQLGSILHFVDLHGEEYHDEESVLKMTLGADERNVWTFSLSPKFDESVEATLLRLGISQPPEGMVVSMPTLRGDGPMLERIAVGDRVNILVRLTSDASGEPTQVPLAESIRVLANAGDQRFGGGSMSYGRIGTSQMALLVPMDVGEALRLSSSSSRSLSVELVGRDAPSEPVGHVTPEVLEQLKAEAEAERSRSRTSRGYGFDPSRFGRTGPSVPDDS